MALAEVFPAFGMETLEKPKAKWEWGISDERVVLNRFYVVAWPGPLCQRTWAGISLSIGVEDGRFRHCIDGDGGGRWGDG